MPSAVLLCFQHKNLTARCFAELGPATPDSPRQHGSKQLGIGFPNDAWAKLAGNQADNGANDQGNGQSDCRVPHVRDPVHVEVVVVWFAVTQKNENIYVYTYFVYNIYLFFEK